MARQRVGPEYLPFALVCHEKADEIIYTEQLEPSLRAEGTNVRCRFAFQ